MARLVTAEVILRGADGSSVLESREAITAENVAGHRVGEEVVEEASQKLEESGFQVLQAGLTSLTISSDKELFEDRFRTKLVDQSTEVLGPDIEGAEVAYYEATAPISVPEDLTSLVAGIVLPTPPQLFP